MEHILSLSYGKDSLACLGAIEQLGWPLDRIVHAEVWATDTIPADLPPMVEFKKHADKIIKGRWGIEVEHYVSKKCEKCEDDKVTYDMCFNAKMLMETDLAKAHESLSADWAKQKQRAEAAEARAEKAERERDAAVYQMRGDCEKCAHFRVTWNGCTPDFECPISDRCLNRDMWEWNGGEKEE